MLATAPSRDTAPRDGAHHAGRPARAVPRWSAALVALAWGSLMLVLGLTSAAGATAAASVVTAAPAGTAAVAPVDEIAWTFTPAGDERNQSRVSVRAQLDPGESLQDTVVLTNTGAQQTTFAIYAADGMLSPAGDFDILRPDLASTGAGQWVTVAQPEVTLEPGDRLEIPVTITVPEDATPGDWPVGVVAAVSSGEAGGIELQTRIGIRVHLQVNGDLSPALEISDVASDYRHSWLPWQPSTVTTSFTLSNTGNVRLQGSAVAELAGPFGWGSASTAPLLQRELLPGHSVRIEGLSTDLFPLGRSTGQIRVTPASVGEDTLSVALPAATTAPLRVWTLPWSQLLVLLVLLGSVWLIRQRHRAARARRERDLDRARAEGAAAAQAAAGPVSAGTQTSAGDSAPAVGSAHQPA